MPAAQTPGPHVGNAQLGHHASLHKIAESLQQRSLLPGGIAGGAPMQLHPIQPPAQTCARGGQTTIKAAPAPAPRERGQLGGHREALALISGQGGDGLPQQALTASGVGASSIGIGTIKKTNTSGDRRGHRGLNHRIVPLGFIPPQEAISPSPSPGPHSGRFNRHDQLRSRHHHAGNSGRPLSNPATSQRYRSQRRRSGVVSALRAHGQQRPQLHWDVRR